VAAQPWTPPAGDTPAPQAPWSPPATDVPATEVGVGESALSGFGLGAAQLVHGAGLLVGGGAAAIGDAAVSTLTGKPSTALQDGFFDFNESIKSSAENAYGLKATEYQSPLAAGVSMVAGMVPALATGEALGVVGKGGEAAEALTGLRAAKQATTDALTIGAPLGASQGGERAGDVIDKGGTVAQAEEAGAGSAVAGTLTGAVPFGVGGKVAERMGATSLPAKIAAGAAGGAAVQQVAGPVSREIENVTAPADQPDMQQDVFQPATDAAVGALFGGQHEIMSRLHAGAPEPAPSAADQLEDIRPTGEPWSPPATDVPVAGPDVGPDGRTEPTLAPQPVPAVDPELAAAHEALTADEVVPDPRLAAHDARITDLQNVRSQAQDPDVQKMLDDQIGQEQASQAAIRQAGELRALSASAEHPDVN